MTNVRSVAILAICALSLTLTRNARAQTSHDLPPTSDIRCLVVGVTMSNTEDPPQRVSGAMLAVFFFGRLDRFPPKAIENAIAKEASTWTQVDSQSEASRCGKELEARAESMNELGKELVRLGYDTGKAGPSSNGASAATAGAAPAATPTSAPSAALGPRTPPMQDPKHPLHLGQEYYPIESRRNQEEGTCVVRLHVDIDGYIRATQLLSSTGFERLNAACLSSFTDGHMIPATQEGKAIPSWYNLRVNWRLTGNGMNLTPQIRDDYELKTGLENYPPLSRKLHQEGDCVVHVNVESDGSASNVSVTKSTGYEPLDQACLSAVQQAQFTAASAEGKAFAASTDINISWRLP
jgi:TonB family protein